MKSDVEEKVKYIDDIFCIIIVKKPRSANQ